MCRGESRAGGDERRKGHSGMVKNEVPDRGRGIYCSVTGVCEWEMDARKRGTVERCR